MSAGSILAACAPAGEMPQQQEGGGDGELGWEHQYGDSPRLRMQLNLDFADGSVADIIIPDCSWTGGTSETRKICALADSYYLPVTCHDATGPVALWAAAHLMLHIPNAMILETVRACYDGWYNDLVTERIPINAGMLSLPERPGLGVALREEVLSWPDARIDRSHGKVE